MSNLCFGGERLVAASLIATVSIFPLVGFGAEAVSTQVQFANSCRSAVQSKFNHAITLLHSFEYPETTRIFREIID
jgi:hypothetical protein